MRREGRDARSRPVQARLQGCTPAWIRVVERRLEQAAEAVEPRRERRPKNLGRRATVMNGRPVLPDAGI